MFKSAGSTLSIQRSSQALLSSALLFSAFSDCGREAMVFRTKKKEHVDKSLLDFLTGKGGSTKAELEKANGVKIYIPSIREAESGLPVEIYGSEAEVQAAYAAIQSKLPYTHFISLPLAFHPALVEKLTEFQDFILASLQKSPQNSALASSSEHFGIDTSGIDKSIFKEPATFHMTILMLKLWNDERVRSASNVLQSIVSIFHDALEGQPLTLNLQGTECLRGSPAKAHVLYARIEESTSKSRLLRACQVLTDAFVESGLVLEKDIGQPLKLHATLMNTKDRESGGNRRQWKREPFDARAILGRYGDWNWGEYVISEAHLSQRFSKDESGYYHCVTAIPFPYPVP